VPAPPSALRLPASVRARARAGTRSAPAAARPRPAADRRPRLRVVERRVRTAFPLEALEVD
jgi:hypothetical protein